MERVHSGIEELDAKIEGGYPKNRAILVTGTTGSGKTISGLHFIYQNCLEGKRCRIIATEEVPEDLLAQAESIGMPLRKYYEHGTLSIDRVFEERTGHAEAVIALGVNKIDELQFDILGLLEKIPEDTDIVLIDNIGVFTLNISVNEFRAQFDSLIFGLCKKNVTTMVILDASANERTGNVAVYSVHGVLKTSIKDNPYTGIRERSIEILKIRNTKIPLDPIKFEITSKGIGLLKKERI